MRITRTSSYVLVALTGLAAVLAPCPMAAQVCHLGDTYVDGSLCVGIDCVCGAGGFGFDTIKLQENNLRIKFNDTSSSASFPNNDWQLTANDSSNGGLNHFSIDDVTGGRTPFRIEAGAPTNTLYVEDAGDVGVGTSNPVTRMHLVKGDSPALRLEQDGSSGFTPQTWDVAGNETNFFIRDVTMGSKLPFRIKPGAPDNSVFIAASANIGLGTDSPSVELHVRRTDASETIVLAENASGSSQNTGYRTISNGVQWDFRSGTNGDLQLTEQGTGGVEFRIADGIQTGNTQKFEFAQGGAALMEIQADGDVNSLTGVFGTLSDRNSKTGIRPVNAQEVLERVAELPISTWRYKSNSDELHMGPMAQDFYAAFGLHEGGKNIALNDLSGVALAAIQGLSEEFEDKEAAIRELRESHAALVVEKDAAIEGLMARVAALEATVAGE